MNAGTTTIADETEILLRALSDQLGIPPAQALQEAVQAYAMQMRIEQDENLLPAEWKAAVDGIAGLWKDRDDLPDFTAIRKSLDRNVWGDRENS